MKYGTEYAATKNMKDAVGPISGPYVKSWGTKNAHAEYATTNASQMQIAQRAKRTRDLGIALESVIGPNA